MQRISVPQLEESSKAGASLATQFQQIVNDLEEFTNELHSQIKQEILSVVPEDNAVRHSLEQSLEIFDNPFSDVEFRN